MSRVEAQIVEGELNATKKVLSGTGLIVHGSGNVIYGDDNEGRGNGNLFHGENVKGVGFDIIIIGSGEIQGTGSINGERVNMPRMQQTTRQRRTRKDVGIPCPDESEESKDLEAKEGDKECEICCTNVVRCISVPCGHVSMCITCSRKWLMSTKKKRLLCTQCREPVDRINIFYL